VPNNVVCPLCKAAYAFKDGMAGPSHGLACPECKKDLPRLAEAYGVTVEELKEVLEEKE
jgi:uncharacterized protein YbaR (Trm112 family)